MTADIDAVIEYYEQQVRAVAGIPSPIYTAPGPLDHLDEITRVLIECGVLGWDPDRGRVISAAEVLQQEAEGRGI